MWVTGEVTGMEVDKQQGILTLCVAVPLQLLKALKKFSCKTVSIRLNDGRYITEQQRRKIYATLRDIADYTGYPPEEAKQVMKCEHIRLTGAEYFSLSSCSMTLAREFINTLLDFCLYNGVQMDERIADRTDDIDHALYSCLKYKKCAICGLKGEVHHWDAIGMGNDRRTVDDRWHRKICLCRKHHTQAHTLGGKRFAAMYHVYGIIYNGKEEDYGTGQDCWWGSAGAV